LGAAASQAPPGHALPRAFHLDPSIYEAELDLIWRRSWLLAGCSTEARDPGDSFRFDLAGSSAVVVRDERLELLGWVADSRSRSISRAGSSQPPWLHRVSCGRESPTRSRVPSFWLHASADHPVLTRLAPAGP